MKLIVVKNQLEGGKEGFKLLSEAMQNGAKNAWTCYWIYAS